MIWFIDSILYIIGKSRGKTMFKRFMILIGIVATCILLNIFAFCLPTKNIHSRMREAAQVMSQEGVYYHIIEDYPGTFLNNWSESGMLLRVAYDGDESLLKKAFGGYYNDIVGKDPQAAFVSIYKDGIEPNARTSYARYWHGYTFLLKLLLMFLSYTDLRLLNQCVQIGMMVYCICLLYSKDKNCALALNAALLALTPIALPYSLYMSIIFYITLFSLIILLKFVSVFKRNPMNLYVFFAGIGIIVSWMDILSYPLVSLCIPLIVWISLNHEDNSIKQAIKTIVLPSLSWGGAYAIMWGLKWILSSIILQRNILSDAYKTILFRTSDVSAAGEIISKTDTILLNIRAIFKLPNIIFWMIIAIIIIGSQLGKKNTYKIKIHFVKAVQFFVIALMPFAWYLILTNHSNIHYWFTHRELAITIFAVLSICSCFYKTNVLGGERQNEVNNTNTVLQ